MTALNPLSDTYATRRNIPLPDTSTDSLLRKSLIWTLKASLKDEVSTGTLAGTRAPASVWTHVASSDSTQFSTSTDLWGSSFDPSKLVFGTAGSPYVSAQSWIVLENSALGYQCCIALPYESNRLAIGFTPIATPFGTFASDKRPVATNAFWLRERATPGAGWDGYLTDSSPGQPYNAHFVTNATNGQFWFLLNRRGTGIFNHFTALQKTTEAHPSDTRNVFGLCHSCNNDRGVMNNANPYIGVDMYFSQGSAVFGQAPAGTVLDNPEIGLGPRALFSSGISYPGHYGIDSASVKYNAFPLSVVSLNPAAWRGRFPDWYQVGLAPVGAGIPAADASQQWTVVGDAVIPFIGGSPDL